MKLTSSLRKIGGQLIHPWVAATAMAGLLMAAPSTYAAAPPANTLIGNQASATYVDPNGQPQTSTSNLVQTTIQQVGSFTLDGKNTITTDVVNNKTGAAGTTVYAPHVLTNTGNGTDSFDIKVDVPGPNPGAATAGAFNRVAVFRDSNFDGLPDNTTELCSVTTASGTCTVPAQTVSGNGGQFGFVVAYTLSATATTPTTPYNSGLVTAKPIAASLGLYALANQTVTDVDNVNLTTAAAFNLSKTIAQPGAGVTAPGGGAWPTAANTGPRSSSTSCSATWSSGLTSTATCQYTVYTMTYTNTGGAPGRFALQDVIGAAGSATEGMTYVAGSAVWSNAPGTALNETAGSGANPSVDFGVTTAGNAKTLTFVDNNLPVNVTRSISFVVLINSTAALGTSTTTNSAKFNPSDASGATATTPGSLIGTTNGAPYTTTGTYSLTLSSTAGTATAVNGKDVTAGTPNSDPNDTTTLPAAPIGGTVAFPVKVWNTGNTIDNVNILAATAGTAGGTAFPVGTTFQYFKADGSTPLTDANADGIFDTGPIQPGESLTVVVKAILPVDAPTGAGPYTLTVTGTSLGDPTQKDATKDVLTTITGVLVDLTNTATGTTGTSGDLGTGPSTSPTTTNSVQPGGTTAFALFIKNNDTQANSYTLASSTSNSFPGTLPAGWTVKFVVGNVASTACAAATGITTPVSLPANTQIQLTACVSVPSSQPLVPSQNLYFQVKSTVPASNGAIVVDVKLDAVSVTAANVFSATLGPATSSGQTTPGGSVVYPQTLTNTGNQSCTGPYTVTATLPPADIAAGWQAAIYQDVNNDGLLDSGDTLVPAAGLPGPLAVGTSQKFLVKIFSSAGAAVGATDQATITVNFPTGSCGTPSSTATTTIVTGQIRLLKTQSIDTACTAALGTQVQTNLTAKPGQCIVYVVKATNEGTAAVSNLTIRDAVPAFTKLHATVQPATQCTSIGTSPIMSNSNYSAANNAVQCGSATTVPPNATMTLTFQVQIDQ